MDNEELNLAQKLEMLRTALPKGLSRGYEPAGERKSPLKETPTFPRATVETTHIQSNPVSSPEFQGSEFPGAGIGLELKHPWKVTDGGIVESAQTWEVVGGTVYGQGFEIDVADISVTGEAGFIILAIERDEATREMTTAVISWSATVPDSDYVTQFRVLAVVGGAVDAVVQHQFEEMRIFELLIVANGEFKLAPFELSSRNTYATPT